MLRSPSALRLDWNRIIRLNLEREAFVSLMIEFSDCRRVTFFL